MDNEQQLPYFERWLYSLKRIEWLQFSEETAIRHLFIEYDTLIFVAEGSGIVLLNSKHYRLMKDGFFYIASSGWLQLEAVKEYKLELCMIQIGVAEASPHDHRLDSKPLPLPDKLKLKNVKHWGQKIRQLYEQDWEESLQTRFAAHMLVQALIFQLVQQNIYQKNSYLAISETIEDMHSSPEMIDSVRQLAKKAHLGARQFTMLFKEMTGLSPLDYISRLRIEHAKQQLAATDLSLSEIARKVGYSDVYYFSRKFKQLVGASPRQYGAKKRGKLKIVALYYSGLAILMGVKPVAANLTWWGGSSYLKEQESEIIDIGHAAPLEQIAMLEPDLILLNDYEYARYEQLQKIATAIYIPYDGHRNLHQETMLFGNILGNPWRAAQFINDYECQAAFSRQRLAAAGIAYNKLKIAIIRFENNGTTFSVFGDNYGRGGWSLYRGLRIQAPEKVQQLIVSGKQIAHQLPLYLLPDYVSDAHGLLVVNEGEGLNDVAANEYWTGLPAVSENRVIELKRNDISFFDPISIAAQLELLTDHLILLFPSKHS